MSLAPREYQNSIELLPSRRDGTLAAPGEEPQAWRAVLHWDAGWVACTIHTVWYSKAFEVAHKLHEHNVQVTELGFGGRVTLALIATATKVTIEACACSGGGPWLKGQFTQVEMAEIDERYFVEGPVVFYP